MQQCTSCLLPETHETIKYDNNCSCNICEQHIYKNNIIVAEREQLLIFNKDSGEFINKERSSEKFNEYFDQKIENILGENPLPFSGEYTIKEDYRFADSLLILSKRFLQKNSFIISRKYNEVVKSIQEALGGIREIIIDGTQETYCDIHKNAQIPLKKARSNIQVASQTPRFAIEAIGMVFIAFLAYFISTRSTGFADAIPLVGTLVLGAQRLLPVLQQIYSSK